MDEVLNSSIKLNANKLNYVSLKRQRERLVPLAFTMPDDALPVPVDGFTISWTSEALANFSKMKTDIRSSNSSFVKNMPYAWLRGLMEVSLQNILRVEPNIGLSPYALTTEAQNQPQPFAYLNGGSKHQTSAALQPLLNDWIVNHLIPYAEREGVLPTTTDQLRELQENNKLLSITPFQSQVLPWLWSEQTGTTKPRDIKLYHVLVDYVARLLAGREIFKELGPLKRIITSRSGITSGLVELITDPILLTNKKGLFSLVIRLEVVTFPSRHQPLLTLNVSKRRWLNSLTENSFDRRVISGLVFSRNHPDRAFSYVLKCKGNQDQTRQWKPDSAFEVLRRELQLPTQVFDGRQIVQGEANNEDCQVMLTYREGIQDREEHGIETGVPEIDKLEAFDAIAKILDPVGLKPFDDYSPVTFGRGQSHITDNTASRMINTPTLLSATLQTLETGSGSDFTPQYLANKNDDEVNHLLRQHFQVGLDGIQQTWKTIRFGGEDKDQTSELEALIAANQEAIRRLYPNERPLFVIFYQEGTRDDLKILEAVIRVLWGNALDIQKNKLPPKTHGLRAELPDKELNAAGRSEKRREAWSGTVRQIAALNRRTFCLILANEFYSDSNDGSSWKHDDPVNKLSTRQALASIAGSCVQFILPSKRTKTGKINFADFLQRIQSATKDLISAHSGRIDGIREKVNHWLSDIPFEARPKEILGITIVRKNSGRARQSIGTTFLPIAIRISVEGGECEMCCAYEQAGNDKISLWQRFPDAISKVSLISPVRLAEKKNVAKTRFMRFVEKIISASVEEEKNPLVVIDSSNCAQLWSWLTDQKIDVANVDIGEHQWMQETWRNARIVRIRQDLAPDIIEDKVQLLAKSSPEDEKSSDELLYETVRGCITWSILFQELEFQRYFLLLKKICEDNSELENRRLQTPSAQITGLFRLKATNQAGCLTYLSLQHDGTNHEKRGLSCYRETEIAREKKIKEGKALLIFWIKRYREIQNKQGVEPEELDLWFISLAYGLICGRAEGNEWKTVYNKAKLRLHTLEKLPPYVDRWATPSPLEIVVALRREGDSSDRLAALVESLRTGFGHSSKWTKLPAPIFFERVVRNYISAFAFEHEDSEAISEVDNSD